MLAVRSKEDLKAQITPYRFTLVIHFRALMRDPTADRDRGETTHRRLGLRQVGGEMRLSEESSASFQGLLELAEE
jgi:hypothetical protein